ncbi:MAG: dienelactone hydrolase family protein [Candidatus Omnitrophica bacterium]|nr:dienelactone hydrolase family protein [Candidatus Omnitrophota bacterium]
MSKRILLTALFLLTLILPVEAAIVGQEIEYTVGEINMKGYLVYDDSVQGKRPGVLVVHEWWGHTPYARKRAEMLAQLGYTALALDMYGDGKTADHPDQAGAFASAVSQKMNSDGKARFLAAMDVLKNHPMVDSQKIAAIGYCFGGGIVLHMARYGVDLKGVVSFHGSLGTQTPAQLGQVKAKILVCNGADDVLVPAEEIEKFKNEMNAAGVDYQVLQYEGAKHSFTNPAADENAEKFGLPLGYNFEADQKSWEDMKEFLDSIFEK